jgi:hypothetical protein
LKHETVHALLVVSVYQGLEVRHFDVKSAFLSGELGEDLHKEQPPGFIEKRKGLVVKLSSSICGLKQSAHVWNKKVNLAILEQGFSRSKADLSLCFRKEDGSTSF